VEGCYYAKDRQRHNIGSKEGMDTPFPEPPRERLLDLEAAAAYLKLSRRQVRDLCRRKAITHTRIDRLNWRFRISALEDFVERYTHRAKGVY
jgi:excisionase family DNA binding protein